MNCFEILCFSKQLKFIHYTNTLFSKLLSESYVLVITQVARDTQLKDNAPPKVSLVGETDKASRQCFGRRNIECH